MSVRRHTSGLLFGRAQRLRDLHIGSGELLYRRLWSIAGLTGVITHLIDSARNDCLMTPICDFIRR